ncbi:DUF4493 domain-containing protein [Bacteroides caecigallinarum]|uniref:DUF4493 domain-containing protein n=1 Tax=Bacteroides caecigallinarum TaxID=1411144 RepID=UPI00195EAF56|nr:DUF4493 domain-containing protein [Bacteroides caecigallinarum]MBM6960284.1 DUF4493 domain-containing protein [Bacteroides caecigallinarum]
MKWISYLCLLVLCMVLTGCQSDEETTLSGKTGLLVTLTDEENKAYSRTAPSGLEDPVMEKFQLKVVYSGTDKSAYKGSCKESVLLLEGLYDLTATYGDNPVIALDAPYYTGSLAGQEVIKGQMIPISIPCSVANSLLSVIYNKESLNKMYESYYVTVSAGSESVDLDADSGKSAYFRAGSSVKLVFHGRLSGTGKEVVHDIPEQEQFANIPVKTHVKVTLGLDESSVTSGVGISIEKLETETVSISETIPVEYLPKPKLETDDFVNNTLSFAETEKKQAVIRLKLSSALQELKLKFNSADAKFAGLEQGREYLLSNAEDKSVIETALGITLPEIGATECCLDFTSLIPQLMTDRGATVVSTVEVDVKANNRWASEDAAANRVYTLTCNKPEFYLVTNPGNFWCKEFSVDSCDIRTGDVETLSKRIQYQYRKKGDEQWIDCDRLVKFDDYPADKQYQVRAVYREGIETEPIDVELETPQQLPNSDMEEWYIEEKKKSGTWPFKDKTYYTFHPYTEGNASSSWWATNNDKAQGGTYALGIWYEGCFASCVSYTEDAHGGGKAALIYLSGCGDGYANTAGTYVGGAMVGSLFIGTYNSGIVQGHDFNSRPTSMSFWYKYKPYNSDAFKVVVALKNGYREIATGTYEPVAYSNEDSEYVHATVDFNYTEPFEKATSICVQFLASNKTSLSKSDFALGTTITYPVIGNWTVHMGSILKIDDVSIAFDK